MTHSTVIVPAVPLGEQLADADARATRPALAGMAALIPAAVDWLAARAAQLAPADTLPTDDKPTMTAAVSALPGFALPLDELLYAEISPTGDGLVSLNSQGRGSLYSPDDADGFADQVIAWGHSVKAMASNGRHASPNAKGITASEFRTEPASLLTTPHVTLVHDYGLGAWRTAPIESATREIVDSGPAVLPWLAAEIVVSDYRSQAYGRRTQLWLHNNRDTAELTVTEARAKLRDARAFLDRFEALIDHAETVAADDFEGDPEIAAADREAKTRRIKAIDEARLARAAALLTEARA